jgi:hypothetical protein
MEGRVEGRMEGRVEGIYRSILRVLSTKDVAVPPTVRARIEACADVAQLDEWLDRAVAMKPGDDLFAD